MAAARAIAAIVTDDELREDYIIPSVFNRDVAPAVADGGRRARRARAAPRCAGQEVGFAQGDTHERDPSRSTGTGAADARVDLGSDGGLTRCA